MVSITNKSGSCHFGGAFSSSLLREYRYFRKVTHSNGSLPPSSFDQKRQSKSLSHTHTHTQHIALRVRPAQLIEDPFIIRIIYYWSRAAFCLLAAGISSSDSVS